ncbi:hypothetical protein GBAR_LOCUS13345 [Geodia barretti]|uniref:Uncharacterized protein n=1 Tax=Geodia barretti TaxID=519541 RepID=A0AA35WQN2_GEOBA|nr:hypothetical protein GBAR_LOCUS13345 [Geodia barretti]
MTGSVSGETQLDNVKTTGKCDKPTPEKSAQQPPAGPAPDSSPGDETSSKKTTLLPPLVVVVEPSDKSAVSITDRESLTLPRSGGACKKKQLHHSSKGPWPDADGRSPTSLSTGGGMDPVFGVLAGDERGFDDSLGARSELSAPGSARSRRRRDVRAFGTLERATSYTSLAATPPRPTFRSANSTRPSPAPPCTTTQMDFCRHPVHPATTVFSSAGSRLARAGTPRRNNPHPVGLHFQSPYNRDGKTFEVWNPDENIVANGLPQMCEHRENVNFTSGKMTNPPTNHGGGGGGTSPGRAPGGPGRSVYQQSYRSPQGLTDYDRRMPTTRFGSTLNRAAAAGVGANF